MQKQNLKQIVENISLPYKCTTDQFDIEVAGIQYDSRLIEQGHIFVALEGGNLDGHKYIQSAVENGAVAVVGSQSVEDWNQLAIPYFQFDNSRVALVHSSVEKVAPAQMQF